MSDEERLTPWRVSIDVPVRYTLWYAHPSGVRSVVIASHGPAWQLRQSLRDYGHELECGYWIAPAAVVGLQVIAEEDGGGDQ